MREVILRFGAQLVIRFAVMAGLAADIGACAGTPRHQAPSPRSVGPHGPFIRGIALGGVRSTSPKLLERKLLEIQSLGANYVSIAVTWSTRDVRSTVIAAQRGRTPPDAVVRRSIERARAHGLNVMLFPIVDVRVRKPLEWRGTLKPASWTLWWRSYRRFILHYAKLATAGATMLCVGSELVSTEHMRDRWRRLIDEVRGVYQGRLLYSANWDHYEPVSFWDLVNLVGLTAYYSLTSSREATETQMLDEWVDVRDQLVDWSRRVGRRIVFTEVGYPSIDGAAVYPWDYTRGGKSDPEEQRRAYRSFTRAWTGVQNLAGVFFWNWYGEGGITDTNYTPRNKPAQNVVKRWFSQFRAIRPNSPKLEPSGARFSDE